MARLIWTDPALNDLDAIADFIALDKPEAARLLVARVIAHVGQLERFPDSGSRVAEFKRSRYRQIIEPPCRVFYRREGATVVVLHVLRAERRLHRRDLSRSAKKR